MSPKCGLMNFRNQLQPWAVEAWYVVTWKEARLISAIMNSGDYFIKRMNMSAIYVMNKLSLESFRVYRPRMFAQESFLTLWRSLHSGSVQPWRGITNVASRRWQRITAPTCIGLSLNICMFRKEDPSLDTIVCRARHLHAGMRECVFKISTSRLCTVTTERVMMPLEAMSASSVLSLNFFLFNLF